MRRRRFMLSTVGLCLLPTMSVAKRSAWSTAASLPINVQELYPCAHRGRLFVAGGIAARLGVPYFTDRCFSYAPEQDKWREEPSLPESLHHAALVSDGENLFCIGGFNGSIGRIWNMRADIYVLRSDKWAKVGELPKPQAEGVLSLAPNGRLHLVSGQSPIGQANSDRQDHREVDTHLSWKFGEANWQTEASIPTPRNSATGGWIGDDLIIAGGRTAKGNLNTTEIYNLASRSWRTAKPLPTPQAGTASVVINGSLVVFGGEIFVPKSAVFANVWRYEIEPDDWTALPDMPTPRHGIGAVRFGQNAYVIGGATKPGGRGTSNLNEVFDLSLLSS